MVMSRNFWSCKDNDKDFNKDTNMYRIMHPMQLIAGTRIDLQPGGVTHESITDSNTF